MSWARPAPAEAAVVHGVGSRAAILTRRSDSSSSPRAVARTSSLKRSSGSQPVVVPVQPVLAHPAFLPFKTSSRASRRPASSSSSRILRSCSMALITVLKIWFTTAARAPLHRAVQDAGGEVLQLLLEVRELPVALALRPCEALRLRSSARSGVVGVTMGVPRPNHHRTPAAIPLYPRASWHQLPTPLPRKPGVRTGV